MCNREGREKYASPTIPDPGTRRQKEKDRSSVYYIYIQQNFAKSNLYCTVRALAG